MNSNTGFKASNVLSLIMCIPNTQKNSLIDHVHSALQMNVAKKKSSNHQKYNSVIITKPGTYVDNCIKYSNYHIWKL